MAEQPTYRRVNVRHGKIGITVDIFTNTLNSRFCVNDNGMRWSNLFSENELREIAEACTEMYKPVGTNVETQRADFTVVEDPNLTPAPYVKAYFDLLHYTNKDYTAFIRGVSLTLPATVMQYLGLRVRTVMNQIREQLENEE